MLSTSLRVIVLGTGTSSGVPLPGCRCSVCRSGKKKNDRLRASICFALGGSSGPRVLVDTSSDLRQQALRADLERIDAVLFTHAHADHILGLDDLRSYNFILKKEIPLYADDATACIIESMFRYAFYPDPAYQGGAPPRLTMNRIDPHARFELFEVDFIPLPLKHGSLDVLGYRVGNFAYMTDCSLIPDSTKALLEGVEIIILDGLRTRPHRTHFTFEQAARELELLKPRKAYLTHVSHDIDHDAGNALLASLTSIDIELAYDGLELEITAPPTCKVL